MLLEHSFKKQRTLHEYRQDMPSHETKIILQTTPTPTSSQEIPRNPRFSQRFPHFQVATVLDQLGVPTWSTMAGPLEVHLVQAGSEIILYIYGIYDIYIYIYMYGYISKVRYLRYIIYMYILGEMGED